MDVRNNKITTIQLYKKLCEQAIVVVEIIQHHLSKEIGVNKFPS
jgi:hypothetical protein